jgi:hypothetical protein
VHSSFLVSIDVIHSHKVDTYSGHSLFVFHTTSVKNQGQFKFRSAGKHNVHRVEYTWVRVTFLKLHKCSTLSVVVLIVHRSHIFSSPAKKKYLTFAYAGMVVEHKVSVCVCIERVKSDLQKGLQNKTIIMIQGLSVGCFNP